MKKYLLMSFSIMVSAQLEAGNGFRSKSEMADCLGVKNLYSRKNICDKSHNNCAEIPENYNCKTFSEQDTQIDDLENPKFTKSEIEACLDEADCLSKNEIKNCLDELERPLMALDFSEIYCSKSNGYNKKTVKMFREDVIKKASNDAEKLVKKNKKDADDISQGQLKDLLTSLKAGTDLTKAKARQLQIQVIEKLFK